MRPDVLAALARVACRVSADGTLRLYHATSSPVAEQILADGYLRPAPPDDVAERMLRRDRGFVFLATAPSIGADLQGRDTVLAVSIDAETPAEIHRERWGDPPRAEIVLERKLDDPIPLVFADRLARDVELPETAKVAIELFRESEVGQQLADPDERIGRCRRASERFISALRHVDPETPARLIEWAWEDAFHVVVKLDDDLIDWTASQLTEKPVPIAEMPWPYVETRARVDLQMLKDFGADAGAVVDPDDRFMEPSRTRILSWELAQRRIPDRGTEQQRLFRN